MSDVEVIQWRSRQSLRWLSLSLAARAVIEGVVTELRGRDEMQLPSDGLIAISRLLGRPWTEVEPALMEAIASGKLRFDHDRNVLVDGDPSRTPPTDREENDSLRMQVAVVRAELAAAAARELSQSPEAVRSRQRRARKVAEKFSTSDERQLDLYAGRSRPVATGRSTGDRPEAISESGVISKSDDATVDPVVEPVATDRNYSPSLSDLRSSNKKERGRPARPRLTLDADAMPTGWLDHTKKLRPDLTDEITDRSWRRFALAKSGKFYDWPEVQSRWESWIEGERVPNREPVAPTPKPATDVLKPPPYLLAAKLARPDEEPDVPIAAPQRRKHEPPDDAARAAAERLAMGAWS